MTIILVLNLNSDSNMKAKNIITVAQEYFNAHRILWQRIIEMVQKNECIKVVHFSNNLLH